MAVRDFLLPDLGEGLEDAEVTAWLVAEGQAVELNQPLAEVTTAKATVEVPAPWPGVIERLHAAAGEVVRVGSPLVSIRVGQDAPSGREPGGTPGGPPAAGPESRHAVLVGYGVPEERPASAAPPPTGSARTGPVPATPPVRRLAKELGIDLRGVAGTGPGGRVTREDVLGVGAGPPEAARGAPAEPGDDVEVVPVRGVRRMVAEQMARSVREIPQVTAFLTLDCTWLEGFRAEIERTTGTRVGALPIVVKALAETCRSFPLLNASFDPEGPRILLHRRCDVGIATDTERGLLVPVVRDPRSRTVPAVAAEITRLAGAARDGSISPADMAGGTVTVSNVGSFGAESGTPIINHPQGAILALGAIGQRALVVGGEVRARPACTLALSFDHRLMDGAEAGRALAALRDLLQNPFRLGALAERGSA